MQEVKAAEALKFATAEGVVMFGGRKSGRKAPLRKPYPVKVEIGARGVVTVTNVETGQTDSLRTGTLFYAAPVEQQEAADVEQFETVTIADVRKGDVIRYKGDERGFVRVTAKHRHNGGREASCKLADVETGEELMGRISRPDESVEILRSAPTAEGRAKSALAEAEAEYDQGERKARRTRSRKAAAPDVEVTAQDVADAELGACEWDAETVRAGVKAIDEQVAEVERARARVERLRNRDALTVVVELVPVPANFLELAKEGNTTAAKRYWSRRCETYTLIETIKAWARANYDLGWDRFVDDYDDAEILAACQEYDVDTATPYEAIEVLGQYADAYAETELRDLVEKYGI